MAIHRDTQGPCPNGFHVPTKDEWVALFNILLTTFGLTAADTTPIRYLRMPYTGFRSASTGSASTSPYGCYHSSTSYEENSNRTYSVYFTQTDFYAPGNYSKTNGMTIRPFKDEPVEPDSGWTILYDGSSVASGAGIFLNSTLSLISVSGDGTSWITIEAKNLGATEISDGDPFYPIAYASTSGNFFQRGNNHPFPWSGTVTTSSAPIDVSNYGPGKYYDSSVFRISTSALDWASPSNNNLWGGVTNGTWEDPLLFTHHGHIGTWHAIGHKDTQGPAPDGFHVPRKDEWVALCGILTSTFSMASNATTMGTYLKMPVAGYRYNSSSNVDGLGSDGRYWSSTAYSTDSVYILRFSSHSINPQEGFLRAYGFSVRCFKDTPVVPDDTWTIEYQPGRATGADMVGIYHNSTLGLISISGDGTTWYTIQDKNLGATTVFNQGDTLTDDNCGHFYQWGNNYGFSHSGTVTTSSTQVDASNYGPGNYYSSSTFITRSESSYDWSSVQNDNLWGGVTNGIRYEVK